MHRLVIPRQGLSAKRTPSVKRPCIVIPRQILGFHAKVLGFHASVAPDRES
jgi:hypothetical protein